MRLQHNSEDKIKLLNCPFCGNVKVEISEGVGEFWGYCPVCDASTKMCQSAEHAANAWNKREGSKPKYVCKEKEQS